MPEMLPCHIKSLEVLKYVPRIPLGDRDEGFTLKTHGVLDNKQSLLKWKPQCFKYSVLLMKRIT